MSSVGFELAAPDVVAEKFQEGLVVLNLATGNYFDLGGRTAPLVEAIMRGVDIDRLKRELDAHEQGAGEQLGAALAQLMDHGLIREAAPDTEADAASQCQAILSAGADYQITCHNDLAELIAADPIHDLDPETGEIKA